MQSISQQNLLKKLFTLVKRLKQIYLQQGFSKKQIQHVLINYILPKEHLINEKPQQSNNSHQTFSVAFKQLMKKDNFDNQKRLKIITEMLVNCENQITKLNNEDQNSQNQFSLKSQMLLAKQKSKSKYQFLACNRLKQVSKNKKQSQIQFIPNEPSLSRLCSIREKCEAYTNNSESFLQNQITLIKSFQKSLNDSIKKTRLLKQMIQQQIAQDHIFGSTSLGRGMFQMF